MRSESLKGPLDVAYLDALRAELVGAGITGRRSDRILTRSLTTLHGIPRPSSVPPGRSRASLRTSWGRWTPAGPPGAAAETADPGNGDPGGVIAQQRPTARLHRGPELARVVRCATDGGCPTRRADHQSADP